MNKSMFALAKGILDLTKNIKWMNHFGYSSIPMCSPKTPYVNFVLQLIWNVYEWQTIQIATNYNWMRGIESKQPINVP